MSDDAFKLIATRHRQAYETEEGRPVCAHCLRPWPCDAAYLVSRHYGQQSELVSLRALVREWVCADCRVVYPGPPQPGAKCVICPQCGGETGPREYVERRLEAEQVVAELGRLRSALWLYANRASWQVYDVHPGQEWLWIPETEPWRAAEEALGFEGTP